MSSNYKPISCSLYDRFEAYAVKKEKVSLTTTDEAFEDIIIDLFSKDQIEFLKLKSGKILRLDHIKTINGISVEETC